MTARASTKASQQSASCRRPTHRAGNLPGVDGQLDGGFVPLQQLQYQPALEYVHPRFKAVLVISSSDVLTISISKLKLSSGLISHRPHNLNLNIKTLTAPIPQFLLVLTVSISELQLSLTTSISNPNSLIPCPTLHSSPAIPSPQPHPQPKTYA